jgi:hypothetical protein
MKNKILALTIALAALFTMKACVYDDLSEITTANNTDESLFAEINGTGYEYYQSGDLLSAASPSPHGSFRLRFNGVAQTSLDGTGELPESAVFKSGAVIVKEIYNASDELVLFAVIKKAPGDINAPTGHLFAEYALNGDVLISIESKGAACVDCHSGTPNRDLIRTFDLH